MWHLSSTKIAMKYAQVCEIKSMRAIALVHQNRNLSDFEKALCDYKHGTLFLICTIYSWIFIATQNSRPTLPFARISQRCTTLLQQNLLRIDEPYPVVEIDYVTNQVGQGRQDVKAKYGYIFPMRKWLMCFDRLLQMILDKVTFYCVLDQGRGCLIIFDEPESDVYLRCEL